MGKSKPADGRPQTEGRREGRKAEVLSVFWKNQVWIVPTCLLAADKAECFREEAYLELQPFLGGGTKGLSQYPSAGGRTGSYYAEYVRKYIYVGKGDKPGKRPGAINRNFGISFLFRGFAKNAAALHSGGNPSGKQPKTELSDLSVNASI